MLLNSMTLSRDGCYFCAEAETEIQRISQRLNCAQHETQSNTCKNLKEKLPFYARPVVLQHFPTYRKSDVACEEHDSPEIEKYRENWEVLSKNATEFLGRHLNPLVAFSGHSHHYCRLKNMWGVEEFTIASFSWRNKDNPSFLLVRFILSIFNENNLTDKNVDLIRRWNFLTMIMRSPNATCPIRRQLFLFII